MKAPSFWTPRGNHQIKIKRKQVYVDMVGREHDRETWVLRYKGKKIGIAFSEASAKSLASQFDMKDLDYSVVMG